MSNVAVFTGMKMPSYLKAVELDDVTKALAGNSGGGGGKRISIRGGVFRMLVNGEELMTNEDRAMNVVIVKASGIGRQYYSGTYEEGGPGKAPNCWSTDGAKPSADVKNPQASACLSCPQNIKGSGQGESRACRYTQRLAVVLEGDLSGDVFQLVIPATSIFGKGVDGQKLPMQAYAQLMAQNKFPIGAFVTEMRFDTSSATPKLTFRPIRPLSEDEYQTCQDQAATPEAIRAVTMTVAQTDGVKDDGDDEPFETPKEQPVAAPVKKAKPAPAPVVEEEDDEVAEVIDEPVVVSKNKAVPEEKSPLTDLIDEWDA